MGNKKRKKGRLVKKKNSRKKAVKSGKSSVKKRYKAEPLKKLEKNLDVKGEGYRKTGKVNTKINEEKEIKKVLSVINKRDEQKKRNLLKYYLKKANIDIEPEILKKKIFKWALIITVILDIFLNAKLMYKTSTTHLILINATMLTAGLLLILLLLWAGFYIYVDMLMFNRTKKIEAVLVDFLQLTSANIRAGMPIDQALWFAIRPRFGILAKEIELVEKKTLTGEPLEKALTEFADKYNSKLLKESISLLIEGMKAGGEIGSLLNNIADNIKDTQILRKEMAANVMTYVIFISASTLFAAPFLMGLSYQLLQVITNIGSQIGANQMPQGVTSISIGFGKQSIKPSDFKKFGIFVIAMTSGISAMIITMIQKGNLKSGWKNIILFIIIGVSLFLASIKILGGMFSAMM